MAKYISGNRQTDRPHCSVCGNRQTDHTALSVATAQQTTLLRLWQQTDRPHCSVCGNGPTDHTALHLWQQTDRPHCSLSVATDRQTTLLRLWQQTDRQTTLLYRHKSNANTWVMITEVATVSIFTPFNFAVSLRSRNSRNKGHANIKGFTVTEISVCLGTTERRNMTLTLLSGLALRQRRIHPETRSSHFQRPMPKTNKTFGNFYITMYDGTTYDHNHPKENCKQKMPTTSICTRSSAIADRLRNALC